jgi:hypothetical protein
MCGFADEFVADVDGVLHAGLLVGLFGLIASFRVENLLPFYHNPLRLARCVGAGIAGRPDLW